MEAPLLIAEVPSKYFDYLLQCCPQPPIKRTSMMSTFEMYQQVRKLNPDLYYDTKTQKQMREDAKRLGDAFFTQQLFDFMEVQK